MTKILLKALIGLKGKGFYIFLIGIVALAACFRANNPSGRISAMEEQGQERETGRETDGENDLISSFPAQKAFYYALTAFASQPEENEPSNKKFPDDLFENDHLFASYDTTAEETTEEKTADELTAAEPVTESSETKPSETELSETEASETEPIQTDPPKTEALETQAPETAASAEKEPIVSSYGQREQYQWEMDYADELFDLVNNTRAQYGLSPLKKLEALTAAAVERAWEIGVYCSHTRPDGSSCFTVLPEHGLPLSKRAENISYYQRTPQSALNSFMSDYAHSAPILDGNFEYMGVGFYYIENDPTGAHYYWTQVFYGF